MSGKASTGAPLTRDAFVAQLASAIGCAPSELAAGEDLREAGLDSLRALTLLEKWRQRGIRITFVELAERTTVDDWWSLISTRQPGQS
jgi:bifunctional isochorismate lyase/aryl carrier protein